MQQVRIEELLDRIKQLKLERVVLRSALVREKKEVLRLASACTVLQRRQAAVLLDAQWGGGVERRLRSLDGPEGYLWLSRASGRCLGHARLAAAATSDRDDAAGGRAAVATSIVIARAARGQGCGSRFMCALHAAATQAGYTYMYLWTSDAMPFYARLGYHVTEGASADTAALRKMPTAALSVLEGMLARRTAVPSPLECVPTAKQCARSGAMAQAKVGAMIHMRKRLREDLPLRSAPPEDALLRALHWAAARADKTTRTGEFAGSNSNVWRARFVRVARVTQVGPSCGLAALRMARAHADGKGRGRAHVAARSCDIPAAPSLLAAAQRRGFSIDGELFDVRHLCTLARVECGLDAEVIAWPHASALLATLDAGHLLVAPYDRGDTHNGIPVCRGGARAHYALIVGCARRVSSSGTTAADVAAMSIACTTAPICGGTVGDSDLIIVAQHGMSTYPVAATFDEWRTSNAQLHAVRKAFMKHGVVAGDGPHLAGKCVLVRV